MKYLYEFIGTFFLIFTIGMTVIPSNDIASLAPLAIGTILAVMVYAGGHISGAHYNPAVSFAFFLRGKLSAKDLLNYWIFQLAAALIAGYLTLYLKGSIPQTPLHLDALKALICEFLFTFALCFVVLNVAEAKETKGNMFFGLVIGSTVLVGAYAVGAISGGAFNPAVAFGICVMRLLEWSNIWIFIVANFLASGCAVWIFNKAHKETKIPQTESKKLKDSKS